MHHGRVYALAGAKTKSPHYSSDHLISPSSSTSSSSWDKSESITPNTCSTDEYAPLRILPSWLGYDKNVLCFFAYFNEHVPTDFNGHRQRRVQIRFYLADGTLEIVEKVFSNAEMDQGLFLKKHHVPVPNTTRHYEAHDLCVDSNRSVEIYGRNFYIYDADVHTRNFYETKLQQKLGLAYTPPYDPYLDAPSVTVEWRRRRAQDTCRLLDKTRQFLKHDRQVLRFWGVFKYCSETLLPIEIGSDAETSIVIVHYYLADHTLELIDSNTKRQLTRRQEVPINSLETNNLSMIGAQHHMSQHTDIILPKDLRIGSVINVYGRKVLLIRADSFTREQYIDPQPDDISLLSHEMKKGRELTLIKQREFKVQARADLHPHSIRCKRPNSDLVTLRYLARFAGAPELEKLQRDRRFLIEVYTFKDERVVDMNTTVAVYEQFIPNSGLPKGKFMERTPIIKVCREMAAIASSSSSSSSSLTNQFNLFRAIANLFKVSNNVNLNSYIFTVIEADDFTNAFLMSAIE